MLQIAASAQLKKDLTRLRVRNWNMNLFKDAVRALVIDSAYSDSTPTTLMLVTHGSWITATISNLLELDPDGMNALGGMRNACWCRLKVRHSVNGTPTEQPLWELEEYNKAPAIADSADWENGPTDLRGPHMPSWQPIVW